MTKSDLLLTVNRQNRSQLRINRKTTVQAGNATIETAIVIPLLLILLVGAVDIGSALEQYLNAVQAAREAARFLGQSAGLTDGTLSAPGNAEDAADHIIKLVAMYRAAEILEFENPPKSWDLSQFEIEYAAASDTIRATVHASVQGQIFNFNYPITVTQVGKYLQGANSVGVRDQDKCDFLQAFKSLPRFQDNTELQTELDQAISSVC